MSKFLQALGSGFSRYWYIILLSCLFIAYLLWLFVFGDPYELTLGISRDAFNIFCGSSATLSGVLLGLIIAAVVFVVQSSTSGLSTSINVLSREGEWLESWLRSEMGESIGFAGSLKKLCGMCKSSLAFDTKNINSDEVKKVWSDMMEVFESKIDEHRKQSDEYGKQLNTLAEETETEITKEKVLELEKQVDLLKKEQQSLGDLMHHAQVAIVSLYNIISLRLSGEVRKLLIQLAYMISAFLFISLIFLALSGAESFGAELLSNFARLNMVIMLGMGLLAILPLLFRILNAYFGILLLDSD
jgi:polyhydroxyalkanoate synthesis regulator phasin